MRGVLGQPVPLLGMELWLPLARVLECGTQKPAITGLVLFFFPMVKMLSLCLFFKTFLSVYIIPLRHHKNTKLVLMSLTLFTSFKENIV